MVVTILQTHRETLDRQGSFFTTQCTFKVLNVRIKELIMTNDILMNVRQRQGLSSTCALCTVKAGIGVPCFYDYREKTARRFPALLQWQELHL